MLTLCSALELVLYQEGFYRPDTDTIGQEFASGVAAMSNVTELHIDLADDDGFAQKLRAAARATKLSLPTVKKLEVSRIPNAAFLLRACPNLEYFVFGFYPSKQWKQTFTAVPNMSYLQYVELDNHKGWKPSQFDGKGFKIGSQMPPLTLD